jgi:hypothetical protein
MKEGNDLVDLDVERRIGRSVRTDFEEMGCDVDWINLA